MEKARLLFLIFIYSMLAMACSPEPEILSGNNSETEISNGNNNQDEENTKKAETLSYSDPGVKLLII